MQTARQRLYLTGDKSRVVAEGDKRASFLFAVPGDEIPESAAARFGLVDGRLPDGKGKPGGGDKERRPEGDKEKKPGATKGGDVDDLRDIKGIGNATAKALLEAGIGTFVELAAVDPEKPPVMIAGAGEADWAAWTVAARERLEAGKPDT
jgi:predicted flap endonuclease-1-like 5' DNA nuclease